MHTFILISLSSFFFMKKQTIDLKSFDIKNVVGHKRYILWRIRFFFFSDERQIYFKKSCPEAWISLPHKHSLWINLFAWGANISLLCVKYLPIYLWCDYLPKYFWENGTRIYLYRFYSGLFSFNINFSIHNRPTEKCHPYAISFFSGCKSEWNFQNICYSFQEGKQFLFFKSWKRERKKVDWLGCLVWRFEIFFSADLPWKQCNACLANKWTNRRTNAHICDSLNNVGWWINKWVAKAMIK